MLIRIASFIIASALIANAAFAMSSTNFQINWDNINSGGSELGTSTNFSIWDTIGDNASGTSTSASYSLSAGYRAAEAEEELSLDIRSQDSSTAVSYSAFDDGAGTVTVSSTALYSVDDYIVVVENTGFSQLIAVGRITDITGTVITVDEFEGDEASMSASPSGGNDFVYTLSLNNLAFGSVTEDAANVASTVSSVYTTAANGYSVYMQANQELQNAAGSIIDAVTDGAVTVGSEEYGAETVGSTGVNTGMDLGVTTTQRIIQTSGASSGGVPDRVGLVYKLSITAGTSPGSYSQTVLYTVTANF